MLYSCLTVHHWKIEGNKTQQMEVDGRLTGSGWNEFEITLMGDCGFQDWLCTDVLRLRRTYIVCILTAIKSLTTGSRE